jgi:hypothetical protein
MIKKAPRISRGFFMTLGCAVHSLSLRERVRVRAENASVVQPAYSKEELNSYFPHPGLRLDPLSEGEGYNSARNIYSWLFMNR